jgi:hypothetical protein
MVSSAIEDAYLTLGTLFFQGVKKENVSSRLNSWDINHSLLVRPSS